MNVITALPQFSVGVWHACTQPHFFSLCTMSKFGNCITWSVFVTTQAPFITYNCRFVYVYLNVDIVRIGSRRLHSKYHSSQTQLWVCLTGKKGFPSKSEKLLLPILSIVGAFPINWRHKAVRLHQLTADCKLSILERRYATTLFNGFQFRIIRCDRLF